MAAGVENNGVGAKGLRAVAGGGVGGEEIQEGGGNRAPEEQKGDEVDGGKEGGEREEEEEPEAVVSATVSVRFCAIRWLFLSFFLPAFLAFVLLRVMGRSRRV